MKKLWMIVLVLLAGQTAAAQQGAAQTNPYHLTIGLQTYHHAYEEPGIMKNDGYFLGVSYAAMYEKDILAGVEGLLSYGQVDYTSTSTGESDDIDDICLEVRGILGMVLFKNNTAKIKPFTGLAYRFLQDDSSHELTTTNHLGYLRESNYIYSPVGVRMDIDFQNGWSLHPEAEYDIFWYGSQESYIGYIPGYEDISNDQDDGYGYRMSLTLKKRTQRLGYSFRLFYRYWDIDASDVTQDRWGRYWIEPANETSEYGFDISIVF